MKKSSQDNTLVETHLHGAPPYKSPQDKGPAKSFPNFRDNLNVFDTRNKPPPKRTHNDQRIGEQHIRKQKTKGPGSK